MGWFQTEEGKYIKHTLIIITHKQSKFFSALLLKYNLLIIITLQKCIPRNVYLFRRNMHEMY